ncbi:Type I Polyketide synthases (Type I PKS) [Penicillium angulare]|uniref:Type I Polyketide synthases (Type I PKS) n=1 Tax=Penicillium angulare TaxID=116970 RepID=A0A9W9GB90_9EURO|nr:Type I Polyketide synthases (Type I PKS) [Penicillium angulare]
MNLLASTPMGESVLLFGSQSLSFDANALNAIRSSVEKEQGLRWIRHTVADLPHVLSIALQNCESFKDRGVRASSAVQELKDWFDYGASQAHSSSLDQSKLPNIILTPLVVISHLCQYIKYINFTNQGKNDDSLCLQQPETCETVGLCTGLLSSLAVSSSHTRWELEKYGAVAIRLAMLVGLVVDARDQSTSHGPAKSIATMWHSEQQKEQILEILASDPETYISVYYDKNRATVTTPAPKSAATQRVLSSAGVTTTEIGLRGRFHWSGHAAEIEQLIKLCEQDERFQFADETALALPNRSFNIDSQTEKVPLHVIALKSILQEPPSWQSTMDAVYASTLISPSAKVVSFGSERCLPPSVLQSLDSRVIYMDEVDKKSIAHPKSDDIAVVGMSIKVAGADDLEEFWDILCKGISQHKEVPAERFTFDTVYRKLDPKAKWYANFLNDPDKFDHKFFKKSPREAESMDPQQRLLLQITYQALEKAGYFSHSSPDKRIGCYMGVCAVDYENNIACHAPNAFTATSHLRGFIAGRVSHHFGWTGPALTVDTACSSSAVAIHQACRAILNNECTAALAGGTQILTSPLWFQNLAGASFLSKTGQCKPFDSKADGYCRGEGVAAVFLKKLSTALADGDQILGVIAGIAVQQNENCTPIVVPNQPSLSEVFGSVIEKANLQPEHITVVEAHGTGTSVGDPVEYASVRASLDRAGRTKDLFLGSVKGLVGHCESASGIISLIKILLMLQKGIIPPQASFDTLNPAIKAGPSDAIQIARQITKWDVPFRAALINNYGASGSNASMIVKQAPRGYSAVQRVSEVEKVPFWLTALNEKSLQAYAARLCKFIDANSDQISLRDLGFNVSRQSNRTLPCRLLLTCQSIRELGQSLVDYQKGTNGVSSNELPKARPLVLCFGGQVAKFIGLNRQTYEEVAILRKHLNICNRRCLALGVGSIYPAIFQKTPIEDIVKLQACLFAMQYSCAKSWIDLGAQPVAVLGHSFGELTALCISGVLSMDGALSMVAARAQVIKDSWGPDGGCMMAIEADFDVVQRLLAETNATLPQSESAEIACYNGPRSFTIAGSTRAIEELDACRMRVGTAVKAKRLEVTHAFHSTLVEPLRKKLDEATRGLHFNESPIIHLERATEKVQESPIKYPTSYVADHMRRPVFFHQALQRVDREFPNAIYLEAGSGSTITNMASRALGGPGGRHFQPMSITSDKWLDNLVDATLGLWKAGLNVHFWKHAFVETNNYAPLVLPTYQFEKSRHWLELKMPPRAETVTVVSQADGQQLGKLPDTILSFIGYQDSQKSHALFRINTEIPQYQELMRAHMIVYTAPICPATVQMDIAIEGLKELVPNLGSHFQPQIYQVKNKTPICADETQSVWLDMILDATEKSSWNFRFFSAKVEKGELPSKQRAGSEVTFTSGVLKTIPTEDEQTRLDFKRYERLIGHERCAQLLHDTEAGEILQGRAIYKTFADIVNYGEQYRGLQRLVGKDSNSAGRVVRAYNPKTWFDAHLSDAYAQVVGIWLNCMTEHDATDIYVAQGFEKWIRSPDLPQLSRPGSYDVIAYHQGPDKGSCLSDIFVFHPVTGQLIEVVLGFQFIKVPRNGLAKLLTKLTRDHTALAVGPQVMAPAPPTHSGRHEPPKVSLPQPERKAPRETKQSQLPPKSDVFPKLALILADLVGVEPGEITINSELADIGVDSLMAMEVVTEIESVFTCSISLDDVADVTSMDQLVRVVESIVGTGASEASNSSSDNEDETRAPSIGGTEMTDVSVGHAIDAADLIAFFAENLGIDTSEISVNILLKELGVDSLLSMEVGSELVEKFGLNLDESMSLEDMSINDLLQTAVGPSGPLAPQSSPTPAEQTSFANSSTFVRTPTFDFSVKDIMASFLETKKETDKFIAGGGCTGYVEQVLPEQTQLCALHTLEAFEKMGSSISAMNSGDTLTLFTPRSEHTPLVARLTEMLEIQTGLIKVVNGPSITVERTKTPYPSMSSVDLMQQILQKHPQYRNVNELIFYVGSNLDRALRGETDGIKLIFGCKQGRELVSGLYGDWIMNICYYRQMQDFLTRLAALMPPDQPLKILEMGAGTGGTSKWLLPLLAQLGHPVEYTFTDLAPSLVAGAKKTFKQFASFMKFRALDIEQEPAEDLIGTQHLVVASNAVHATVSLIGSAKKLRSYLRPNGILMMLEMVEPLYWIDMIFGLFEGWWLFADGRSHALTPPARWKTDLQAAGFGFVDWSDGSLPENSINKVIVAVSCEPDSGDVIDSLTDRKEVVEGFVHKYTAGIHFSIPATESNREPVGHCVVVTGGTGSVGAHVVAQLVQQPSVTKVICLNRRSKLDGRQRQLDSLTDKCLILAEESLAKIVVIETDLTKPQFGLQLETYKSILEPTTHIIHNAWAMSIKRPVQGFEAQFRIMRNLIEFARDVSSMGGPPLSFQFISSIATVGQYPIWKQDVLVPECRLPLDAVLPIGYGDAKHVCELMLDETLHRHPHRFRTSTVRLGQVGGSKISGYWNPVEHLSFLFKSSQTIQKLPDLHGTLSWTPVDDVAKTLVDLLFVKAPYPVYHVENPVGQPWEEMIPILAEGLGIPRENLLPLKEWLDCVRAFPEDPSDKDKNPATALVDFIERDFERMSVGGLLLDTTKSREHSPSLQAVGPITPDLVRRFISYWRSIYFLI